MPELNYIAIIVAALVPNVLGAIYYGPLLGNQWRSSLNLTSEDLKGRNEALIYGSALLLACIVSFFLKFLIELTHKEVGQNGELVFGSFHTFGHGALHGAVLAIGLVIPVLVCLGLFQKTKGSNIIINCFFWLLCFSVMGGILDAWS
ncbi:MAG: DUF1761 domain-containing protein [Aureispira sp.]